MRKIRSDIVLVVWLLFLIITIGNYFLPVEKKAYKNAESSGYEVGMPADDTVTVVSTMEELEKSEEESGRFAIRVQKDKLKKTSYYYITGSDNGAFHSNPVFMAFNYAFSDKSYDRVYVAELEDGNRILVRIFERAADLSGSTVTLPIGKTKKLKESSESFEKINEKFDLTTEDATSWYVDASGYWFRQSYIMDKVSASNRNWGILAAGMIIYAIVSTVAVLVIKKGGSSK